MIEMNIKEIIDMRDSMKAQISKVRKGQLTDIVQAFPPGAKVDITMLKNEARVIIQDGVKKGVTTKIYFYNI